MKEQSLCPSIDVVDSHSDFSVCTYVCSAITRPRIEQLNVLFFIFKERWIGRVILFIDFGHIFLQKIRKTEKFWFRLYFIGFELVPSSISSNLLEKIRKKINVNWLWLCFILSRLYIERKYWDRQKTRIRDFDVSSRFRFSESEHDNSIS